MRLSLGFVPNLLGAYSKLWRFPHATFFVTLLERHVGFRLQSLRSQHPLASSQCELEVPANLEGGCLNPEIIEIAAARSILSRVRLPEVLTERKTGQACGPDGFQGIWFVRGSMFKLRLQFINVAAINFGYPFGCERVKVLQC